MIPYYYFFFYHLTILSEIILYRSGKNYFTLFSTAGSSLFDCAIIHLPSLLSVALWALPDVLLLPTPRRGITLPRMSLCTCGSVFARERLGNRISAWKVVCVFEISKIIAGLTFPEGVPGDQHFRQPCGGEVFPSAEAPRPLSTPPLDYAIPFPPQCPVSPCPSGELLFFEA